MMAIYFHAETGNLPAAAYNNRISIDAKNLRGITTIPLFCLRGHLFLRFDIFPFCSAFILPSLHQGKFPTCATIWPDSRPRGVISTRSASKRPGDIWRSARCSVMRSVQLHMSYVGRMREIPTLPGQRIPHRNCQPTFHAYGSGLPDQSYHTLMLRLTCKTR